MTELSSGFTYRAFISYSHRDRAWGDWLHKALETYRVPARLVGTHTEAGNIERRLSPVFRDREELSSSSELGSKINAALTESENLVVICSPAAAVSRWVNDEVIAYQRMGRGDHIFCLIVAGEPNATDLPGRAAEECFCPALRFATDANGKPTGERTEPIAADARPGKDGKFNAKLKLIAGMLGVGFDALKQREQHRRMRRMAMVTTAAVAVMAITIVLAAFALFSRHEAVLAKHKAVVAERAAELARDDAKRRQAQAEDILGFMLGDLRKKLATVGRLDLMRAVDDKATTYFATLKPRDLTDAALEQQARLLMDIGQVRLAKGEFPEASAAFHEALDRTSALYARAPTNGSRLFDKAQAEYWVGYAAMQKGDNATAETMFNAYYTSAVKLAAMDRHNFAWQKEVAYGLQAVSVMDKKLGRTAAAERGMQKQLAMYRVWLKQRPNDLELRYEGANIISWLGSLALEQGQLQVAERNFAEQVHDMQQNMAAEPDNATWKDESVSAYGLLVAAQTQRGEFARARATAAAAVALAAALHAKDPTNNDWSAALGVNKERVSELAMAGHDVRAAIQNAAAAETLLVAAHAKDPKNLYVIECLTGTYTQQARLALTHGDTRRAADAVGKALQLVEPAWAASPSETLRLYLARAKVVQGEAAQREGHGADAKAAWTGVYQLLMPASRGPVAFDRLDPLVRALRWLGRGTEAEPYLQRLTAAGYVPLTPWPNSTTPRTGATAERKGAAGTPVDARFPLPATHSPRAQFMDR